MINFRLDGTHRGEFRGVAPTGATIDVEGIGTFAIRDGTIVEQSAVEDDLASFSQIDAIDPPTA